MPPKIAKLAGLGALAACGGIAAVFALFVYFTRPVPTSGLDPTNRFLSWFTVAGVIFAVIEVHVVLSRQLLLLSKGEARPI